MAQTPGDELLAAWLDEKSAKNCSMRAACRRMDWCYIKVGSVTRCNAPQLGGGSMALADTGKLPRSGLRAESSADNSGKNRMADSNLGQGIWHSSWGLSAVEVSLMAPTTRKKKHRCGNCYAQCF
jgi:hypothetical protein